MKKKVIVILLIFCTQFSFGRNENPIIVTAISGLSVRNSPSLKANKIGKIPYLTTVEIIHKTNKSLNIKDEGKIISGYWMKIKYLSKEAYVFDGFLATKKEYSNKMNKQFFVVDDVEKSNKFLKTYKAENIISSKIEKDPFLIPSETEKLKLIGSSNNCFLETVQIAYANHYPLVLSPDTFWTAITQGFSIHINENFKELSPKIFKKNKPKRIVCRVENLDDASKWGELVGLLANETRKYTHKDFYNTYVPKFSTTTPIITATYQITLLESFKQAFQYVGESGCGIPYVVLKGNTNDWEYLKKNIQGLKGYGLDEWLNELVPVISQCIQSSKGNVDTSFWSQIYKTASEYGGMYTSGWIIKFFPYLKTKGEVTGVYENGRGSQIKEIYYKNPFFKGDEYLLSTLSTDMFPTGVSQIDVLWKDLLTGKNVSMEVFAGFLGIQQHKDKSLEPYISYSIAKKGAVLTKKTKTFISRYIECGDWSPNIVKTKYLYKKAIYDIKNHEKPEKSNAFLQSYLSKHKELKGQRIEFTVLLNGSIADVTINNDLKHTSSKKILRTLQELPKEWFPAVSEIRYSLDGDYSDEQGNKYVKVNSRVIIQL